MNYTQLGSTGQIVHNLATELKKQGHEVLCVFGLKKVDWPDIACLFIFKNQQEWNLVKVKARSCGKDGFVNGVATRHVLRKISEFKPDVIHFHNMHGEWIDISPICAYVQANHVRLIWTAHDCWLATGRCAHFSFNGCQKAKIGCGHCQFRNAYPKLYGIDLSTHYWKRKRDILSSTNALILTPSKWLKDQLEEAGIKNEIEVVGNPIDSDSFKCIDDGTNFRGENKSVGFCAFDWNESKGLKFAQELAERLAKTGIGSIFVGLSPDDDRLPKCAKGIARTNDKTELADFYRSVNVFVNTTMLDVLPSVNIEAIFVGTPVVTFASGGAGEMIREGVNGYTVKPGDLDALERKVRAAIENNWDRKSVASSAAKYQKKNFMKIMLPFYLAKN